MASLRELIALEIVARLGEIDGWTAVYRGAEETTNVAGPLAIVAILGESKTPRDTLFYACTLRVGVLIRGAREDADPTLDGSNPVRYLDRLVALAEQKVHAAPWPNDEVPTITGHTIDASDDATVLEAQLELTVDYRHNFGDPNTYDPAYVP